MIMKTILKTIAVMCLFCLVALRPLGAQAALVGESGMSNLLETQKLQLEKEADAQRMQLEKDLESDRLNQQKEIAKARYDSEKDMVHDLAWNSWVIFVIAMFFFEYLKNKRRHETIRLMIQKGTPITPELLAALGKKSSLRLGANVNTSIDPCGYLRWGITLTLVGFALLVAIHGGGGFVLAGWILLAVGVADLILWFIDRSASKNDQAK